MENKESYTTYFNYEIVLNDTPSEVIYKKEKVYVDNPVLRVQSVRPLTLDGFKKLFEGTEDGVIKKFSGDFKTELGEKYDKLTNEKLEEFLLELTEDSNIKELFEDVSVKDLGNGLYQIGKGLITGKKGLEEFDKVMRTKTKEYGIMKENNKYYTPDISEFHVGFEYEFNCPTGKKGESEWKEEIYNEQKWFHSSSLSYEWLIKEGDIRVKYLDSLDIQDLGFKLIHNDGDALEFSIEDKYGEVTYLWFDYEDHNVNIYVGDGYDKEYLFQGIIKNKSELKRVLKQIGVEYVKA